MDQASEETRAAEDRDRLITVIEQAFASTPMPERITDCDKDCPECNDLTAEFQGQRWRDISDAKIEANRSLALFVPKAFHYFLPAYLRYSLRHFSLDSEVCEFTVYSVLPSEELIKDVSQTAWMRERLSCFDQTQADVILQFLSLVSQDPELSDFHSDIAEGISYLKSMLRDLKLSE